MSKLLKFNLVVYYIINIGYYDENINLGFYTWYLGMKAAKYILLCYDRKKMARMTSKPDTIFTFSKFTYAFSHMCF